MLIGFFAITDRQFLVAQIGEFDRVAIVVQDPLSFPGQQTAVTFGMQTGGDDKERHGRQKGGGK